MDKHTFVFTNSEYPFRTVIEGVHRAACIQFPIELFVTNAISFKDVKQFATRKTHLQALMTFCHLTQNIQLCDKRWRLSKCSKRPPLPGDRVKVLGLKDPQGEPIDSSFEIADVEEDQVILKDDAEILNHDYIFPKARIHIVEYMDPSDENYFMKDIEGDQVCSARFETLFEIGKSTDRKERICIRLWLLSLDPMVDLGSGVEHLIQLNQESMTIKQKKLIQGQRIQPIKIKPWESYLYLNELDLWAFGVCDAYTNTSNCSNNVRELYHPNQPLSHRRNPANPYEVFRPNRAMKFVQDTNIMLSQKDIGCYRDGSTWRFPEPELTFHIKNNWMNPRTMYVTPFPSIRPEQTMEEAVRYNEQVLSLLSSRTGDDMDEDDLESDMEKMANFNEKLLRTIQIQKLGLDGKPYHSFSETMNLYKSRGIRDFSKVWSLDANISEPCKRMLEWKKNRVRAFEERGDLHTMKGPGYVNDGKLSVFANMIIRKMQGYEILLQFSTAHREMLLISIYRLNAYTRSFKLHNNWIMAGLGSTSKSYCIEMCEKTSIPHTIQIVTHQTAKANAIDGNQNDTITLFHEMPTNLMGVDVKPGTTETGDSHFKDQLTSCKFRTKLFTFDEITGRRSNRVSESECIGIIGGATNDKACNMPEALLQRFHLITCSKMVRKGREVNDLQGTVLSDRTKLLKKEFLDSCHTEQFLYTAIEKLIWTKLILDVNMEIALKIFNRALSYLYHQRGIHETKLPRHFARMFNTARTLTILYAIEYVFNRSNFADGEYTEEQLMEVEPYLVCTEEIAMFTLTLTQEQYINPTTPHIIEVIAKDLCKYTQPCQPPGEGLYPYGIQEETDYIVCKYSMYEVVHMVSQRTKKCKISPNNVELVLKKLRKEMIKVKRRDHQGQEMEEEHIIPIVKAEFSPEKRFYISAAYVDQVLFNGSYDLLMQDAIRATLHKKTRPRTILTGETYIGQGMPQYLKTMEIAPSNSYFSIKNTNFTTEMDSSAYNHQLEPSQAAYLVDEDFELIECRRHWVRSGRDIETFDVNVCPNHVDASVDSVRFKRNVYPRVYIEQYRAQQQCMFSIDTNQEEKIQQKTYNLSLIGKKRSRDESLSHEEIEGIFIK